MPLRRKRARRPKKKKSFMPRTLAVKRYNQASTKVFYFKGSGTVNSDNLGISQVAWLTQHLPLVPGNPNRMPNVSDAYTVAECYNEYKVLAIRVRIFSANIGTEPGQADPPNPPVPGFNRGNTIMYIDQDVRPNEPLPNDITNVINYGSARMIPTLSFKHTKFIKRPSGQPLWGCCDRNVPVANRTPDPWFGGVYLLGEFARPAIRPLWFYSVTYKIIFRGRSFTP